MFSKVLVTIYHSTWYHFPKDHNFNRNVLINVLVINHLDALISQIYFGRKLYMFRTVPLSIHQLLYTQQWYMSSNVYVLLCVQC